MRLWKRVDGEPYMINPRLGVLALQALNPKRRKKMAHRHYGARHMAWVRSFRKKNRSRRSYRRRNPYPMAGVVSAIGNYRRRHHYKHNPSISGIARGTLGLPPLMPVVYGAGGFIGTAMVQGFVDTLVPATWKVNSDGSPSMIAKYGEIAASIGITTFASKMILGRGASAMAAVGGGIYALQQAVHDFLPGAIPGMHSYTPLKSYTPLRPSSAMGRGIETAGGQFPQLATRASMPQLAARDIGAKKSAGFADDGGMNVVAQRFRRFA
jgi:hypothetical protein